jgi:ribosomal protein L7/L12
MPEMILLMWALIIIAWIGLVLAQCASIKKRLAALTRMEAKVDLLLKQAGATYDPYADVPANVADALAQGKKILAIKHYREATGAGLKEAKDFVEEVQRRAGQA